MRLSHRLRYAWDHRWAPGRMSDYLDNELAPDERARMERHRRECAKCDRVLAELRALLQGLRRLPAPEDGAGAVQLAAVVRGRLDEPPAS